MRVDVLLETFGSRWPEVRRRRLVGRAGRVGRGVGQRPPGRVHRTGAPCAGVLDGPVGAGRGRARITIGPLVLDPANRDPVTLAVMASTLQHLSGGRLWLGIGAGARFGSQYAAEQEALGHHLARRRRAAGRVEHTIAVLRQVWSGVVPPAEGFLRPDPPPPVLVAASGPKMAALAGRMGDGICGPGGTRLAGLVAVARQARGRAGHDPGGLLVTASLATMPPDLQPWVALGVDRLIVYVGRPFEPAIAELGRRATAAHASAPAKRSVDGRFEGS